MKTVNVTLRLDKDLKERADALFAEMGLSLNAACRVFLARAVQEQDFPFELRRADRKTRRAIAEAQKEEELSEGFDNVEALMRELDE